MYSIVELGVLLGQTENVATGINDAGEVVGHSGNRAFLWSASAGMQELGTLPGRPESSATGISDAGEVVGGSWRRDNADSLARYDYSVFLWNASTGMQDLGEPAFNGIIASVKGPEVSDKREVIIGAWTFYSLEPGDTILVWRAGTSWRYLNNLISSKSSLYLTRVNSINNRGQIVGEATRDLGNQYHGSVACMLDPL